MCKSKVIRLMTGYLNIRCTLRAMGKGNADAFICDEDTGYSVGYIDFRKCKLSICDDTCVEGLNVYEIIPIKKYE